MKLLVISAMLFVHVVVVAAFAQSKTKPQKHRGQPKINANVPEDEVVDIARRVVGGSPAVQGEFTFMVTMHDKAIMKKYSSMLYAYGTCLVKSFFCGAFMITSSWICTAAHCATNDAEKALNKVGVYIPNILLNFGDINLADTTLSNAITRDAEKRIIHEGYDSVNIFNDIALLKTDTPVTPSNNIYVAYLPKTCTNLDQYVVTLCGNGVLVENGTSISPNLMKVDMPVVPNSECQTNYDNNITSDLMCAGYMDEGQKDGCDGDSGSALSLRIDGTQIVVGCLSFGYGCARIGFPSVYTRMCNFTTWIQENIDQPLSLADM